MNPILCVDVGLANIGAAIVDPHVTVNGGYHNVVEFAYFRTDKSDRRLKLRVSDDKARRVQEATRFYRGLIFRHGIKRAVCELPTGGAQNAAAAADLAMAGACFISTMEALEVACEFYSPDECKVAATGKRTASKDEVMEAIARIYPQILDQFPAKAQREHVSDGAAVYLAARSGVLFRL